MKMKKILLLWLIAFSTITFGQQDQEHTDLIRRERAQALSKMLRRSTANTGNYDIKFHRIYLHPSMSDRQLTGSVTTYFVPNQNINQIEFDLNSQMTVQSVVQRNNNLNFSQTNNRLIIDFPQSINNGTLDSLTIQYSGSVPDTGLGSYVLSTHNGTPIVWTLSEPYGARDWWPCKQDLTDKADSIDVILKYPKNYNGDEFTGVSNGVLTSESVVTENGTQYKISTWKHRYPIAAYLVAFAISNYTLFSQTAGINQNFPIDNYVFPEDLNYIQSQSGTFVPVMNFFEQTFGHYPFNNEKYGQIQFGWGGGMEHQTATFLVSYTRSLMGHELAHQWFGDAITCGSWHDIWLNEGFATYAEALIVEHFDGQAAFDAWKTDANSYITSAPDGAVYVQDTTNIWRIFDARLSYRKGAMVLNMLRLKTGDNNFFEGLRNYVNQKSFQYVLTPEFKSIMENQSGQDLTEFFNDWIYGEGYPNYYIQINRIGTHLYNVYIHQTTSDTSVNYYEMPLPFTFSDNNGNTYETVLENTFDGQNFTVDTGFEITQVEFDPHHDIIMGDKIVSLVLNNKILSPDSFSVYPNPAKNYIRIENRINAEILQVMITDLNGKIILENLNKSKINTKDLTKGTYILKLITNQGIVLKKFIKN